jgi:hypothetical protein
MIETMKGILFVILGAIVIFFGALLTGVLFLSNPLLGLLGVILTAVFGGGLFIYGVKLARS